jgi:hypothetical protein
MSIEKVKVALPNHMVEFDDVDSFEDVEEIAQVFAQNFDNRNKVEVSVEVEEKEGLGELFGG